MRQLRQQAYQVIHGWLNAQKRLLDHKIVAQGKKPPSVRLDADAGFSDSMRKAKFEGSSLVHCATVEHDNEHIACNDCIRVCLEEPLSRLLEVQPLLDYVRQYPTVPLREEDLKSLFQGAHSALVESSLCFAEERCCKV